MNDAGRNLDLRQKLKRAISSIVVGCVFESVMWRDEAVVELEDRFEIWDQCALFIAEPCRRIERFRFDAAEEVLVVDPVAAGEDPMRCDRKIDWGRHRDGAAKATVFGSVLEKHIPAE